MKIIYDDHPFFIYEVNKRRIAGVNKKVGKLLGSKVSLFYAFIYECHHPLKFDNMLDVEENILKRIGEVK